MSPQVAAYKGQMIQAGVEPSLALTAAELLSAEAQGHHITLAQRGIISMAHQQIIAARSAA